VLPEIEARRTDEIADVFDEQQIEPGKRYIMQCPMYEVRIEVTGRSGRDLYRRHAVRTDAGRVVVGFQITLDHADAIPMPKRHDRRFQQRGFSGARRGHEVNREHAVLVEVFAVVHRDLVVGGQQILQHVDYRAAATIAAPQANERFQG